MPILNNPRWEIFATQFVKSGNATKAAEEAGYIFPAQNASRLKINPTVSARIAELMQEMSDSTIADAKEIRQRLTAMIRGETEEDAIVVEAVGDYTSKGRVIQKKVACRDQVKAAEILGKMDGLFSERVIMEQLQPKIVDDI